MTNNFSFDISEFDANVRPQDDLFKHLNGVWVREFEMPADQAVHGAFHELRDKSEADVRAILEEAMANPKPGVSQQIGDMYASFLNEDLANSLGAKPILAELANIDAASFAELSELQGKLSRDGIDNIFGVFINNDPGDPTRYIPYVYQAGLGLPDEAYYHEEKYSEFREAYLPYIAKMLEHAGWSSAQAAADAESIMQFETAVAKLHWTVVETRQRDKTYNLRSFAELKAMTPTIDWAAWAKGSAVSADVLAEVNVMTPSFFEQLHEVYNETNVETVKLWLKWQVINAMAPYLSNDFVNTRFDFYGAKLTGQPELKARWKRAVAHVEGSLGEAVGEIYVQKHFSANAKARMDELVQWLLEAYRVSISELTWMTEETKAKALVKLTKFSPMIGYPNKWEDYSSLVVHADDLVGNVRRTSAYITDREIGKIGKPIDHEEWHITPQTVNAYYNPTMNQIVFPAAILQPPFFNEAADDAVNFGAIGQVIGHEIGHGFDDQGSKYDGDGALNSWWTDEDRAAFEERTKSLIAQYDGLTPDGLSEEYKVNGELTIGENIGDLGGVMIAWKAYQLSLQGREPEVIDGLTAAERFLYSWGRIWRGKSRENIAIQRLGTDPHSPVEFRLNQVAKNFDLFHETFDTKPGDGMWLDPAERVTIW